MRPTECPITGCLRVPTPSGTFQGLCAPHYQQRKRYGMSIEDMCLAAGVTHCQACGISLDDAPGRRQTDHDHESGHVRGILCHNCNVAEGMLRDEEHVARLMAYVERTRDPNFDWAADRRAWLKERTP